MAWKEYNMAELDSISTSSTSTFSAYGISKLEDVPGIEEFNSSLQSKHHIITNRSHQRLKLRQTLEKMKFDLENSLDDLKNELQKAEHDLELALAEREELSSSLLKIKNRGTTSRGGIKIGGSLQRQTSYKCIMQQLNESHGL